MLLLDTAGGQQLRYPRVPQPVEMAKQLGRSGPNDDLVDDFEAPGVRLPREHGQTMGKYRVNLEKLILNMMENGAQ